LLPYVLSPIDLMPGPGDDLLVVALGSLAVAQLVPMDIMAEHRATAARVLSEHQVEDEDDG
jgi:uncharacterized membrane protein YkvA (DUF1232 family)